MGVGDAVRRAAESRILGELGPAERAAQAAELLVVAGDDHDLAVAAIVDAALGWVTGLRVPVRCGTRPVERWLTPK